VKGGFSFSRLAQKFVPFETRRQFCSLCSETLGFLIDTFGESFETATLHDTTSLLRVLTAGFASSNRNMPPRIFQSNENTKSKQATADFKLGH
jgi:hypothetical protein